MPLPINNHSNYQPIRPEAESVAQPAAPPINPAPPRQMPATGAWRVGVDVWVRGAIFSGRTEQVGRERAQREMLVENRFQRDNPHRSGNLNLDRRNLSSLPPMFPVWVSHLNVAGNRLRSLRNSLPARLESLNTSNNQLRTLPNSLPSGLRTLNVSHNQLRALPCNLPRTLRTLELDNNELTSFPENLPRLLSSLSLRNNRIVDLPESAIRFIVDMGQHATIDLRDNPLSPQTALRLNDILRQANYDSPDNQEQRGRAIQQLNTWLQTNRPALQAGENVTRLELSDLELNSLPPLPEGVTELDITNNFLHELPENLPRSLNFLDASDNQLTTLSDNHFYTPLGGDFTIVVTRNPLSRETINRLDALRNNPQYNGAVVHYTSHHEGGPQDVVLRPNSVADTAPQAAPADRAPARRQPDIADTQPVVPGDRRRALETVLAALPAEVAAEVMRIRQNAEAAGNPIPPENLMLMAFEHLAFGRAMNAAPAQAQAGQAFPWGVPAEPAADLGQAAATWAQPPHTNIAATTRLWQGFASEPGAPEFAQFLNRLGQTVNTNEPAFQRSVAQWLTQLEGNPSLRESTFAVGIGATESCEDRISLTYNAMRKLSMAADVSRGNYDQRLPELITLARGMFRLEQLENIARETTASLVQAHGANRVDEIEVYLGYQVMLREPLALPVETANMAYFRVSGLTQSHLTMAQARVLIAERRGFVNYLSTNFAPWQEVIQRMAPELHEQAQDTLIEAMGNEFTNRLNTRLREVGLQNDPDAERTLGPQVQAEITREIRGQLSRDFLASKGMLNLLG